MLEHRLNLIPSFIKKLGAAKVVIRPLPQPGKSPVCKRERALGGAAKEERAMEGGRARMRNLLQRDLALSLSLPRLSPTVERTSLVVEIGEITILIPR